MPHLSPTTLTANEQRLILGATAGTLRDHLIFSIALGTGLRLAEIVGLDVGDVFAPDGTPRIRVRVRKEIAKGGRAAGVFLPDRVYGFHALRHTAVTNVYRVSRDLFLAQRFARHVSPLTTTVYTHPSDDEMHQFIRRVRC